MAACGRTAGIAADETDISQKSETESLKETAMDDAKKHLCMETDFM